jgi:TrkA domain protein
VAVIRNDTSIPGPGPEFEFDDGDVVLLMGTDEAVSAAGHLLTGG